MTMDAEHNEHNPTIPFHLSHEDCDIHITHISKNHEIIRIVESSSGHIYIKMDAACNETTPASTQLHPHMNACT